VNKETSQTVWGFATFNLTIDHQTQNLSVEKHEVTAAFNGDYDYGLKRYDDVSGASRLLGDSTSSA
jgi:hypothetical protein